jgi:hypothetical protein
VLNVDVEELSIVSKAKDYPFLAPKNSYLYLNGKMVKFAELRSPLGKSTVNIFKRKIRLDDYLTSLGFELADLTPVLAYGSNASNIQLQAKFSGRDGVVIPVVKAYLHNFDVVYSAHISPYGAIPATLQFSPKTVVTVYVTFLNGEQLNHMHETENLGVNYSFIRLYNVKLELKGGTILNEIYSYISLHGCLYYENFISLSTVTAKNRVFPEMSEVEVLKLVKELLGSEKDLDAFILENVRFPKIREKRIRMLKEYARELTYKNWEQKK